jgi:N-acetylglucosamine kinase-like BadF-type ATPase
MEYLLGIDNGGTVTKAAIYNTGGEELYCRTAHCMGSSMTRTEESRQGGTAP